MLFKLLLLFLAFVSAHGLENSSIRRVRSPEPSGWQGSNGYGASLARSGGGWGNGALGRSSGWGGSGNGGTRGYSSNGINGNSGCASSNGWGDSSDGFLSNRGSHTY